MFAYSDSRGRVDVAFTDRHRGPSGPGGGPSASLGDSLTLAVRGEARAETVARNLLLVATGLAGRGGASSPPRVVAGMRQVHGADVAVVAGESNSPDSDPATWPVADGLVTAAPGVTLLVRVADCVPVLLADPGAGVVGAVHAGRKGVSAGVVPAAVEAMRGLGAGRLTAWVGPHVCGRCYEVPEAMREDVAATVPAARATTSWGTPALDLGAGVAGQLEEAGVADLTVVDRCTLEDDDLFSHRREGEAAGRGGGVVWVRP